jgi:hypothetical protein
MSQFYLTHSTAEFLSQAVTELGIKGDAQKLSQAVRELLASVPWGHHANALARVSDPGARIYYLRATARLGWTRDVLLNQVKAQTYERPREPGTRSSRTVLRSAPSDQLTA